MNTVDLVKDVYLVIPVNLVRGVTPVNLVIGVSLVSIVDLVIGVHLVGSEPLVQTRDIVKAVHSYAKILINLHVVRVLHLVTLVLSARNVLTLKTSDCELAYIYFYQSQHGHWLA